jgi:hypothetical protein
MEQISAHKVRERIQHFWTVFSDKAKSEFEAMYLPSATVFAVDGRQDRTRATDGRTSHP